MSTEKQVPENLRNRIKKCPVDFGRVDNLIKRAKKDLSTSKLIKTADRVAAYTMLYDGILHAGLAYMAALGIQPDMHGKHKIIIDYVGYGLGKAYEEEIQYYDRMRRKRHQFIYEPSPNECTQKELKEAASIAKKFLKIILAKIKSVKDSE